MMLRERAEGKRAPAARAIVLLYLSSTERGWGDPNLQAIDIQRWKLTLRDGSDHNFSSPTFI